MRRPPATCYEHYFGRFPNGDPCSVCRFARSYRPSAAPQADKGTNPLADWIWNLAQSAKEAFQWAFWRWNYGHICRAHYWTSFPNGDPCRICNTRTKP